MDRLCEPSTWRGLVVLASVCGLSVNQDDAQAIAGIAAVALGVVEIIRKG